MDIMSYTIRNYKQYGNCRYDIFNNHEKNINGRDVQRKNVVNNEDKSSLWAP